MNADPSISQAVWRVGKEISAYHATWFSVLKPVLTRDGDMWCALLGTDLQIGIAGFGPTPEKLC